MQHHLEAEEEENTVQEDPESVRIQLMQIMTIDWAQHLGEPTTSDFT